MIILVLKSKLNNYINIKMNKTEKRKKIAILIPSLRGGGAERVMLNIAKNLSKEKMDVRLIVIKKVGAYIDFLPNDLDVVDLDSTRVRYSLIKLVRALNEFQPDRILSTMGHLNLVLIMLKPFLKNSPLIFIREAISPSQTIKKPKEIIEKVYFFFYKYFYPRADLIIAQCEEMKKDIMHTYKINGDKIKYIYNPVDIEFIKKESEKFNPFDSNTLNVIAVGRLSYQKGFDVLIDAFKQVTKEFGSINLTILGEGELESFLKKKVEDLELSKCIKILGFVKNPYPYYKNADLFVLSSRYEGFPNVLIEALACGTKVVSTKCKSGPREILGSNQFGLLVEVENADSLAKGMIKAIREKSRTNDRADIYDITKIINEYEALLDSDNRIRS